MYCNPILIKANCKLHFSCMGIRAFYAHTLKQHMQYIRTSALQLGSALHSSMSTLTQDANPPWQTMCKGWTFCYNNRNSPSYISIHVWCGCYLTTSILACTSTPGSLLRYFSISTFPHVAAMWMGWKLACKYI